MATIITNQAGQKNNNSLSFLKDSIDEQKNIANSLIDNKFCYLYFNKLHFENMNKIYGTEIELGKNILECISNDDDKKKLEKNFNRALRGENHSSVTKYGTINSEYYETFFHPVQNENSEIHALSITTINVTKYVPLKMPLNLNGNELIKTQRLAKVGSWTWQLLGNILIWSHEMYRLFGVDSKNYNPSLATFHQFIHPDDCYKFDLKSIDNHFNKSVTNLEFRIILQTGEVKWIFANGELTFGADKKPYFASGICQDITQYRQTEKPIAKTSQFITNTPIAFNTGPLNHIHYKLRYFRESAGLTQSAIAEKLYVGLRTYQRIENAETVCDVIFYYKFCLLLKLDFNLLISSNSPQIYQDLKIISTKQDIEKFENEIEVQQSMILTMGKNLKSNKMPLLDISLNASFVDSDFMLQIGHAFKMTLNSQASLFLTSNKIKNSSLDSYKNALFWDCIYYYQPTYSIHKKHITNPAGKIVTMTIYMLHIYREDIINLSLTVIS